MNLRSATCRDARPIAAVHVASTRAAYRGLFPDSALDGIDAEDRAGRWRQTLSDANTTTLIAESDGQTLGFVNFGPCRDEDAEAGRVGEVMSVYVAPDCWGKGVGRRLLRTALEQLAGAGFGEAKVWVLDRNARAVAFYERAGFVRDDLVRHHEIFGVPVVVVRYRTCLPGGLAGLSRADRP
jgi:ribosomal protein S18 acetylase RimI-like enzyme